MKKLVESQKVIYDMECLNEKEMTWLTGSIVKQGKGDIDVIKKAVNKLIELNDALRTKIEIINGKPYQSVCEYVYNDIPVRYYDNREELLRDSEKLAKTTLDDKEGLAYFFVLITPDEFGITAKTNHIISDAWTYAMLANQFYEIYDCLLNGKEINIETYSYMDYVERENEYLESSRFKKDRLYWREQVKKCSELTYLVESRSKSYDTERKVLSLSKEQVSIISKYCKENKVSSFALVMTVLATYIYQLRDKDTFYIGTTLLNRIGKIEKNTMGMFVSTVPILFELEDDKSFSENMKKNMNVIMKALKHQKYNYKNIMKDVFEVCNSTEMLYDVLVSYQNTSICGGENHSSYSYTCGSQIESLQLHIDDRDQKGELILNYDYHVDKFSEEDILRIHEHIVEIIGQVVEKDSCLKDISLVTETDKNKIMNVYNNTSKEYPSNETIVGLFEKQVSKTPDNVAVSDEYRSITYRELNARANSIGAKLRSLGIGRNDFVCVIAERSVQMIEGIYGIIKSGGAYVPIDPNYPDERIRYILDDCNPKAIITYTDKIDFELLDNENIIDLKNANENELSDSNLEIINTPEDILYVIYTSGTTGAPKGVMNKNCSLINRILWMNSRYPIGVTDTILQKTTYTFDVSVWEILWWSLVGSSVVMLKPEGEKDPKTICETIQKNKITTMHFVPSMLSVFLNYVQDSKMNGNELDSLRFVFSSGEALNPKQALLFNRLSKKVFPNALLVNLYGPTEAAIDVTYFDCDREYDKIPIGKPIDNTQIYINKRNKLCGIGIPGELCIAGDNVALGYLNKKELTEEKFVDNPYGKGKMYKTGDLARWLSDGNIEYLGRMDDQVKIRGFRIELGEIETKMRGVEGIKDCAVIAKEDFEGEKAIFAYYVCDSQLEAIYIKSELKKRLPYYMVPAYIMQIDSIPVTKNGKLDRSSLPEIEKKVLNEYIKPETKEEEIVCRLFEEILHVERVGILDNFFELGGHSLRATRLANKLELEFNIKIELKRIFECQTPKDIARLISETEKYEYNMIPHVEEKKWYPMSSTQRRLYLLTQMNQQSVAYNMPAAFRLYGNVKIEKIKKALEMMIQRHEILRTYFKEIDGELVQCISKSVDLKYEYIEECKKSDLEIQEDFVRPFNLEEPSQLRVMFVRRDDYTLFLFDMHHIISDGFSLNIFKTELVKHYNGEEIEIQKLQYKDYSEWMRKRDFSDQKKYWIDRFDDIPILDMPLDYERPKEQQFDGNIVFKQLGNNIKKKIKKLEKTTGATEYMLFLSFAMVLLSKYSRQQDIVIGSPVSARVHKDTEKMLGMFVNTLAIRGNVEKEQTFRTLLNSVKDNCLNAYKNQEYPFEELVEALDVRRDYSRNPLFDVMLVYQNTEETNYSFDGVELEPLERKSQMSKFDMTFDIKETVEGYEICLEYCTKLYKESTIIRLLDHYANVIGKVCENIDILIKDIELLTETEKNKIMEFNNTKNTTYPVDKTVVELFEEQVKNNPDKVAVVFENKKLTYSMLNTKANQIAHKLRELGVFSNQFVPIISERSLEMIIGIYGIIKAGAAYVPIDPNYPIDRVSYIIEDCNPKAILSYNYNEQEKLKEKSAEEINILDLSEQESFSDNEENLEHINSADDLIYCIYTSGTTGKPKGAMLENKGMINRIYWMNDRYPIFEDDVIMQKTTYTFDVSVWELFWWALKGASVVLLPVGGEKEPELICKVIDDYNVTTMHFVPSMLNVFLGYLEDLNGENISLESLKYVFASGEKLPVDSVRKFYSIDQLSKGAALVNLYGPTEASIDVTYFDCSKDDLMIPIGKPISNIQIYIVNDMKLCGIGIPGELCIAGIGLARGYLNREELTNEKFINNPFGIGKLYRTGDLARWMEDGNIEYLGRIDDQVKIRGLRIELGEIEAHIKEIEKIKDCAVIVREDRTGEKAIFAYFVSEKKWDILDIKEELSKSMPSYMVPAYIMQIDSIPVTKNGKLDRRALPKIEMNLEREYIEPKDDKEKLICGVFEDILGVEKIGITDNFFENGGDSIKAIRIISKLRAEGYNVAVKDIMMATTAERLAKVIVKGDNVREYEQGEITGEIIKTPIIKMFDDWNLKKPNHFNQANIITVNGIENEVLRKCITELVAHHDVLRAVYKNKELNVLSVEDSNLFDFYEYDYSGENDIYTKIEKKCSEIQGGIDLENGPLVKVAVFDTRDDKVMMIAVHHLIIDGVSWRIIQEDIQLLINQVTNGQEIKLPQKTASYIEWSRKLDEYRKSEEVKTNKEYWEKINKEIKNAKLFNNDSNEFNGYAEARVLLDKDLTSKFVFEAINAYNTNVEELLTSALAITINRWKKIERVSIDVENYGRDGIDGIEVDRTVGWFTNIYPVIIDCSEDVEESILNVKEAFWKVKGHTMEYGLLIERERNYSDITFNYLGDFGEVQILTEKYSVGECIAQENKLSSNVTINCGVFNNCLSITVIYDKSKLDENDIKEFCDLFERSIRDVVELCVNNEESVLTIYDLDEDIESDDLDAINSLFE